MNNNKIERLNGEIRDREKIFRGLKKKDTPILEGMKVYHNVTKIYNALKGKILLEETLIKVDGKTDGKLLYKTPAYTNKIPTRFKIPIQRRSIFQVSTN